MEDDDKIRIIDEITEGIKPQINFLILDQYCSSIEDLEFRNANLEFVEKDILKLLKKKLDNKFDISEQSVLIKRYFLNKLKDLVNEFDSLCIKKSYNYRIEVDRASLILNESDKNDIVKFVESYRQYSFLVNENIKDFKYSSIYQTTQILINKILKKYENRCYIISQSVLFDNDIFGISLVSNFDYQKIKEYLTENELKFLSEQFGYCIKNKVEVIAVPISIPGHANALIYKTNTNTFEYFEPHGVAVSDAYDIKNSVDILINKIIEYLSSNKIIAENPKYKDSEQTCPILTDKQKKGFQVFEDKNILSKFPQNIDIKSIKLGYCQMWALFYLELSLRYPDIDTTILNQTVFDYLKNRDEDDKGFLIFITGYIYKYYDEIKSEFDNMDFDEIDANKFIESVESKSKDIRVVKKLKKIENLGLTCLNFESNENDEVLEYLNRNIKNNIIIGIEFKDSIKIGGRKYAKDTLFCYKRDKLINSMEFITIGKKNYYKIFDDYEDENIYVKEKILKKFNKLDLVIFNLIYVKSLSSDKDLYDVIGYDIGDYGLLQKI